MKNIYVITEGGRESFISQVGIQYSTTKVAGKNANGTCRIRKTTQLFINIKEYFKVWGKERNCRAVIDLNSNSVRGKKKKTFFL